MSNSLKENSRTTSGPTPVQELRAVELKNVVYVIAPGTPPPRDVCSGAAEEAHLKHT